MTPEEAKQVIEVLARGIDPATGEVLPEDSPLNSPHVIRALFLAAKALEAPAGKRERPSSTGTANTKPANAGKAWAEDESQRLAAAFTAGASVAELAKTHQRSTGAITSRLIRLGLMEPSEDASS
jgi:hypothetical protein